MLRELDNVIQRALSHPRCQSEFPLQPLYRRGFESNVDLNVEVRIPPSPGGSMDGGQELERKNKARKVHAE